VSRAGERTTDTKALEAALTLVGDPKYANELKI
jgi:hypothetical protein